MAQYHPTETLTSSDIPAVSYANKAFGSDSSLLVARPGKFLGTFPLFWLAVPEGFYALVTRHGAIQQYKGGEGKPTPVWPAGVHMGPPWLKVSHLVTKQSMIFNTPIKGCKTKDNVTVQIDVALVLRVMGDSKRRGDNPWNVCKFVHGVTAHGLQQQLMDAQAEAVRTLARSLTHTEVFGLRSVSNSELAGIKRTVLNGRDPVAVPLSFDDDDELDIVEEKCEDEADEDRDLIGEHDEIDPLEAGFNTETGATVTEVMRNRLNRQFKPQGVEILDVIIQQITLPDDIQKQMSNKTMVISQNAEQRMQQKYDLLTLSQKEAIKTLQQTHRERKAELTEDRELKVQREALKLEEEKTNARAEVTQLLAQADARVSKLDAESKSQVQGIRDKTVLATEEIICKSDCKATELHAKTKAAVSVINAKAKLRATKLSAKGEKALFHAEGVSAPLNRTLNNHTTELKKYKAQEKLASNKNLVITGTTGGKAANRLILTEAALSAGDSRKSSKKSKETTSILSQLAVATGKAQVRLNVWDDGNKGRLPY